MVRYGKMKSFALSGEMGTGKTWIIINNVADLWSSGECFNLLVFAPNGVHSNWTRLEIPRHMPDWVKYKAAAWSSNMNKFEKSEIDSLYDFDPSGLKIMTMNWEAMQHKKGIEAANFFCRTSRRLMIVCDESDSVKNPAAIRTKELMKLKMHSDWRRTMTGTPVNNSPFDLFSQYSFLDESILQTSSFFAFKAEYAELLDGNSHVIKKIVGNKVKMSPGVKSSICEMVDRMMSIVLLNKRDVLIEVTQIIKESVECENWENAALNLTYIKTLFSDKPSSNKDRVLGLIRGIESIISQQMRKEKSFMSPNRLPQIVASDVNGRPKYRNLDKLSQLIAPYTFRVLKKDCLDLPDKIYKTVFFEMTTQQKAVYEKAKVECRLAFEGEETVFSKLTAVTKLAQITSGYYIHPLSDDPCRIDGGNPKLDLLADRVKSIIESGGKVIIWARYTMEIEDITSCLRKEFKEEGRIVQYYGATNKGERVEAIESFQNGVADIFVGNQQAGGTGITLTAANYVIYFSNNFSLRDRLQSEDRAHRIGQSKNVTYINIAAKNTIDEHVIRALLNKKDVADEIIDKGLALFQ